MSLNSSQAGMHAKSHFTAEQLHAAVSEALAVATIDRMVSSGLLAAGYNTFQLDGEQRAVWRVLQLRQP